MTTKFSIVIGLLAILLVSVANCANSGTGEYRALCYQNERLFFERTDSLEEAKRVCREKYGQDCMFVKAAGPGECIIVAHGKKGKIKRFGFGLTIQEALESCRKGGLPCQIYMNSCDKAYPANRFMKE